MRASIRALAGRIRTAWSALAPNDRLGVTGLLVAFTGGLALWWQVAIIFLGLALFATAVARALLGRKGAAGTGRHEG